MRQLTLGVQLKERATFASFLTARNTELVAHLRHIATTTPASATWIAGPHSAGKSHLLQAVCAATLAGKRAAYLPLESLLPFGPAAIEGAEQLDVACYDDVQTIAGLDDWEQKLFSLWQRAADQGTTLLFAARENPTPGGLRAGRSQVAIVLVGGVRGARAERRRAAPGAGVARATARLRAADRNGALPAAALSPRHALAVRSARIPWMTRPFVNSAGSRCRSSSRSST